MAADWKKQMLCIVKSIGNAHEWSCKHHYLYHPETVMKRNAIKERARVPVFYGPQLPSKRWLKKIKTRRRWHHIQETFVMPI